MKKMIFVLVAVLLVVGMASAGTRTFRFENDTGAAADDLHIRLVNGSTYDAFNSSPFLDEVGTDGGTNHDLSNGTVANGASATVRFTSTSPRIKVKSWYWTVGGFRVGTINQGDPVAAVSIGVRQDTRGEVTITYEGPLLGVADSDIPRAFALDVSLDSGGVITGIVSDHKIGVSTSGDPGYGIFPGSIGIVGGVVDNNGTPEGSVVDYPGVTEPGIGSSSITIEMGSLYVDDGNRPLTDGDLITLEIANDCNISVVPNLIRGGVVMESASQEVSLDLAGATVVAVDGDCGCYGDIGYLDTGTWEDTLGQDGVVNFSDLNLFLGIFVTDYALAPITPVPLDLLCFDMAYLDMGTWMDTFGADGIIDFSDLNFFLGQFVSSGFSTACITE